MSETATMQSFSSQLGQIIRKFLDSTHRNIDLSLEQFALQESHTPGVVVELIYRGSTFEELESTPEGEMPALRNHTIQVKQNDNGEFYLTFSQGFYLIEGYHNMKRILGSKEENQRYFLAAFYTCIMDIIDLSERYNVSVTKVVTPGNFFQKFKLHNYQELHNGLFMHYV